MAAQKGNPAGGVVGILVVIGMAWYFFGGGLERQVATNMSNIEQQVAADAVKQYNIAKSSGKAMDACVQAGLVSAAYLQAKDQGNYQSWKAIEDSDCRAAGVPR